MDRRGFLKLFSSGIAAAAVAPVIPFNRVWSFPKEIVIPKSAGVLKVGDIFTIRTRAAFQIGDVVAIKDELGIPGYNGPFLVCAAFETDEYWLRAPRHNITAYAPGNALDPIFAAPTSVPALLDLPDQPIPPALRAQRSASPETLASAPSLILRPS
jgi:hypothetical protein